MVLHHKYLIFIDDASLDPRWLDYFRKFDWQVKHYAQVSALTDRKSLPTAILINADALNLDFSLLENFFLSFSVPLLIISDHKNEELCIRLLEAGADDFLVKPIHPRELHARINAINRRVTRLTSQTTENQEYYKFAQWRVYPASRKVFNKNNQEIQLSAGEYNLLLTFIKQPQKILARETLLHLTQHALNSADRKLDVQISRLRQKIEPDTRRPIFIKTIRNSGYLFTCPVSLKKN